MPAEYIRQTHVPSEEAMREWFRTAQAEATTEGMTWFRFSVHSQHSGLILIEGWPRKPKDAGPQNWSLQEEPPHAE